MKRSIKFVIMIFFLGFTLLFFTSTSQCQWYPLPIGINLGFYGFPGNGYWPLAPIHPYYIVPYGWNQPYNSNGYSYYGRQPYYGYYSYTPGSLQRARSYQKANGSSNPFLSVSEYPIYEYPMYYEGDQVMELLPRNPAFPPFASVFGGTGRVVLSSSIDDLNIVNPESPLYYLIRQALIMGGGKFRKGEVVPEFLCICCDANSFRS